MFVALIIKTAVDKISVTVILRRELKPMSQRTALVLRTLTEMEIAVNLFII